MAKNIVYIEVQTDDKGTTKRVALSQKQLEAALDKTSRTGQKADRALKGAAQASSNSTKNFSKTAGVLQGGLVPAYAALAAQLFALSAAFGFLKRQADLDNLRKSQISYAQSTGNNLQQITQRLREASGAQLAFQEAAQAAAIGLAKGFTSSQLEDLAEGARKASTALGRSYEDTFDRLVRGVSKAEPELLDELGITLRLETATKRYAAAVGKTAKELTTYERSQAVLVETQRQLNDNFKDVDLENTVNPFLRLQKVFQQLVEDIATQLLPTFKSLANFLADNAEAAKIAFAGLALVVASNITGLGDSLKSLGSGIVSIFSKLGTLGSAVGQSMSKAFDKLDEGIVKIDKLAGRTLDAQKKIAQAQAKAITKAIPGKNKPVALSRLASGQDLTSQQSAGLSRAIKSAETQLKEQGKITRGIFKDVTDDMARDFIKSFRIIQREGKTTSGKLKKFFLREVAGALRVVNRSAKLATTSIKLMGKTAGFAARNFRKLASATVVLSIVGRLIDSFDALATAPIRAIDAFISFGQKVANVFEFIFNGVIKLINNLLAKIPKLTEFLGISEIKEVDFSNFSDTLEDGVNATLKLFGAEKDLAKLREEANIAAKNKEEAELFQNRVSGYNDLAQSVRNTAQAIIDAETKFDKFNATQKAIQTSGISSAVEDAIIAGPKAIEALKNSFSGTAELLGADFAEAFYAALEAGKVGGSAFEALIGQELAAGAFIGKLTDLQTQVNESTTTLAGGNVGQIKTLLNATRELADDIDRLSGTSKGSELFNSITEEAEELRITLNENRVLVEAQKDAVSELAITQEAYANQTTAVKDQLMKQLEVQKLLAEQDRIRNDLQNQRQILASTSSARGEIEQEALQDKIRELERQELLLEQKISTAEARANQFNQILLAGGQAFESQMISAFDSIIQGTSSVKDAFKNMAVGVLRALSQIIAKMLVVNLLQATGITGFFSSVGGGDAATTVPPATGGASLARSARTGFARYGGIMSEGKKLPGFSDGGIAKGPNAGYPVTMHGTEAVVPLPNNREIPVELKGAGQMNNVTVNVSMDGNGNAASTNVSGDNGKRLGTVIAKAVQEELQNQKRAGGILSPLGAA